MPFILNSYWFGEPPVVTLDISTFGGLGPDSILEAGGGTLIYTFSRTGSTDYPLTVYFTLEGSTASYGSDYSIISGTSGARSVTFTAGSATAAVVVAPNADGEIEGAEGVIFTIVADSSYVIGSPNQAIGAIVSDDSLPPPPPPPPYRYGIINYGQATGPFDARTLQTVFRSRYPPVVTQGGQDTYGIWTIRYYTVSWVDENGVPQSPDFTGVSNAERGVNWQVNVEWPVSGG
jgi:hypothetical protein